MLDMNHSISKKDAMSAAMKLCSKEERCIWDVREKLEKWGLADKELDEVIEQLVINKFIDEKRYALHFTNDRIKLNRWGRIKIRQALTLKQVNETAVAEALQGVDSEEYLNIFRQEMQKKLKSINDLPQIEKKARLYRFAAGRGFENEIIYKIIDELI